MAEFFTEGAFVSEELEREHFAGYIHCLFELSHDLNDLFDKDHPAYIFYDQEDSFDEKTLNQVRAKIGDLFDAMRCKATMQMGRNEMNRHPICWD